MVWSFARSNLPNLLTLKLRNLEIELDQLVRWVVRHMGYKLERLDLEELAIWHDVSLTYTVVTRTRLSDKIHRTPSRLTMTILRWGL